MDEKRNDLETPDLKTCSEPEEGSPDHAAKKKAVVKKTAHDRIHKLEEEIAGHKKEKEELHDKYLRTLAETDNFRKRVAKEKDEYRKYIITDFLLEILPVFDNLERALKVRGSGNEQTVISGVEITVKQFQEVLKNFQVQEIDALNKPFNPELHEALAKEESPDVTDPTVVEVYQKGFLLNQRLLRPALTKVLVPKATIEPPTDAKPGS